MSDQRVFPEEYTEFAKKHYFLSGLALVLRTQHTHAIVITKQRYQKKKLFEPPCAFR